MEQRAARLAREIQRALMAPERAPRRAVLMIAFHYPPSFGSSGLHRTLKFSQYLPSHGWKPLVLTVRAAAHEKTNDSTDPPGVDVTRAFAFDTARQLAFRGAYPRALALPDRWSTWWFSGVVHGLRLIRLHRPSVLWSTFPIATAHLIALTLHRITGIPWVADFRDPMTEVAPVTGVQYPMDAQVRRAYRWIEARTIRRCSRAVFVSPGTADVYRERFPDVPSGRFATIANGFDEEDFTSALESVAARPSERALVLVHSGILYPSERDPRAFLDALARMKRERRISASDLRVVLRASGSEAYYQTLLGERDVEDIVRLEPAVPYADALREMMDADGLLVFQAANCNRQIPAKLYECLRARRPILALTDAAGDTAGALRAEGIDSIVRIDDADAIHAALGEFIATIRIGTAPVASLASLARHSREAKTAELASVLDSLLSSGTHVGLGATHPVEGGRAR
jgi:hypothetical protein